MQRYVEQLIDDIGLAIQKSPPENPNSQFAETELWDQLITIDDIISLGKEEPMVYYLGINDLVFPPSKRLTPKLAELLARAILDLWTAFRIEAEFPEGFPLAELYPMLLDKMREPLMHFPIGLTHIEFCDYEPTTCPFGEKYCTCNSTEIEVKPDEPCGCDENE
ncbi:MAG: hypothetical protein RIS47_1470 [Bacteroidota bacterium]|jgi:hypothetical protein